MAAQYADVIEELPAARLAHEGEVVGELRSVTKSYGATLAADDVSLQLRAGRVLALIGENGAGKSTCVKVLAGVVAPDEGDIVLAGRPVRFHSPLDAQRAGIAVVHQHPGLFPHLSIAENVFAGRWPRRGRRGVDRAAMRTEARRWLEVLELDRDPELPVGLLRTSEQQLVEIARALAADARILVMDEPTAALPSHEVDRLFAVIDSLRGRGVAMMFVGHRLEEIFRVADDVTILRDGRRVATAPSAKLTPDRAVELMVGRALTDLYPERQGAGSETVLAVRDLSRSGEFEGIDLEVRAGEIVGLAGLVGSGRTELARALFGITQPTGGEVLLDGRPLEVRSSADALKHGIAYVSEDRRGQSLVLDFGVLANATLPTIAQATRHGLISREAELSLVEGALRRMRLRFRDYDQPAGTLSGGNQQKVVLAKWLATTPRVLILDEPTQGVDVQVKVEVHRIIAELADQGLGIILISSDLPEVLGMSDRVIVMREGRAVAQLEGSELSEGAVARAATGVDRSATPPAEPIRDAPRAEGPATTSSWQRLLAHRELGLVAAMLLVALPVTAINPRFLTSANLLSIGSDASLLALAVAGQMLVVITRNIDLSVASTIGLSAYISADVVSSHPALPVLAVVALACGVGLACGLLNGAVVTVGAVPSIVVTLGTLSVYRGLVSMIAGDEQVSADQVPQAWLDLTSAKLLGVPMLVPIALVALGACSLLLRRTAMGRELYAIGSNPEGAALIGIRVHRRVLQAFVLSGVLAGFAGALWASRYATIDARVALGVELTVIASVVVGGVAIFGGTGTVLGIALGTLTLLVIQNGLELARVDPLWLQGVYGLLIVVAVAVDHFVGSRSTAARAG